LSFNHEMQGQTVTLPLTIAYYSARGHTGKLASAVAEGACEVKNATAYLIALDALTTKSWAILESAHAMIFGSPTYMAEPLQSSKSLQNKRWRRSPIVSAGGKKSQLASRTLRPRAETSFGDFVGKRRCVESIRYKAPN
jgi:flavorubredoxin